MKKRPLFWITLPVATPGLRQWGAHGREGTHIIAYAPDEPQHGYAWSRKRGNAPAVVSSARFDTLEQAKAACQGFEDGLV